MTDFDADEPVEPPRKSGAKPFWTVDRIIGWSGAALAMTAAFFPWYVFFNEDQFGIRVAVQELSRDLPEWAGRAIVTPSPAAIVDRDEKSGDPLGGEKIITGSIPDIGKDLGDDGGSSPLDQAFPGDAMKFKVLHVANGRAMIEDKGGVYLVQPGSILPDASKVAALEQREGKWVVVTDKGTVYGVGQ